MFVDATFYLHRLIGDDLRTMAAGPADSADTFPDAWIAEFSVRVNHLVGDLEETLFPPAIEVAFGAEEVVIGGPSDERLRDPWRCRRPTLRRRPPSIALLFVPGLLFMSMLFMAQGIAADLWQEREQHTLRRVITSPRSTHAFLLGKVLGGAGVMFAGGLRGPRRRVPLLRD